MAIFKLPWGVAILTGQSLHLELADCRNLNVCKKTDFWDLIFNKISGDLLAGGLLIS